MREIFSGCLDKLSLAHIALPTMLVVALLCLSSPQALFLGIALALTLGNPFAAITKSIMHKFLALAIVGLGFGTDLLRVQEVGLAGIQYTLIGLLPTFSLGLVLGRMLKTASNTSLLISVGTGICGGSAIAAVAPVINARSHEVAVALATVFVLNACALFVFPPLGRFFGLSDIDFGLWCALAIHDTSSVVGAAMQFGERALALGTTVKLARALWIMPVALALGLASRKEADRSGLAKIPWFIPGFLIAAAVITFMPSIKPYGHMIEQGARRLMVGALFLVGLGLSRDIVRTIGLRSFVQGFLLWLAMGGISLYAIMAGWVGFF